MLERYLESSQLSSLTSVSREINTDVEDSFDSVLNLISEYKHYAGESVNTNTNYDSLALIKDTLEKLVEIEAIIVSEKEAEDRAIIQLKTDIINLIEKSK